MERDAILKKKGLTEHYRGNQALNNTYLGLSKGDHIAMVSDDGAGKSTFVRNLTDGEKPTSGTISLHGEEVKFTIPCARDRYQNPRYEPTVFKYGWRATPIYSSFSCGWMGFKTNYYA